MKMLDQILEATFELPSFPLVLEKSLRLIEDPKSTAKQIVELIQLDQAITVSVLKLCNSAFFGLRRPVSNLRDALVMVGFNPLMEVILSQQSGRILNKPCEGYELEQRDLWRHSVSCALLSQIIARRLNSPDSSSHFTAALLHDLGKLILGQFVSGYFRQIRDLIQGEQISFTEAERAVLGIDHAELGARIAEKWDFPPSIVAAIRYHHNPSQAASEKEIVELISLCDLVAMLTGIGGGADGLLYHGVPGVMRRHRLKHKDIELFIVELSNRFQTMESALQGH